VIEEEPAQAALEAAISGLGSDGGNMVTKWVALFEVIEEDGNRVLWTLSSKELKTWESLGMFMQAIHVEQAETIRGNEG
jgi:hypothetical protein